jgi:hypothetical protein
LRDRSDDATDY